MFINAYQELVDTLAENGKAILQVEWAATSEGSIDLERFFRVFEGSFYRNPSPFGNLDPSMIVVGRDFYLTRKPATNTEPYDYWLYHEVDPEDTPFEPMKSKAAFEVFKVSK